MDDLGVRLFQETPTSTYADFGKQDLRELKEANEEAHVRDHM